MLAYEYECEPCRVVYEVRQAMRGLPRRDLPAVSGRRHARHVGTEREPTEPVEPDRGALREAEHPR